MSTQAALNVTALLKAWSDGDSEAADQLIALVYDELRRQAARYLSRERGDHTLRPTALVNEAYLRLVRQRRVVWQDRGQFFAVAATVMRRLLVDYARQEGASKRGGSFRTVSLEDGDEVSIAAAPDVDIIALNDALVELSAIDPQRARMIELRFFAGLTTEETAEALGVSTATVTRGWRLARAWLHRRLTYGHDA
jgi:RNA polymerase sigma factor (TIGR02999 family)